MANRLTHASSPYLRQHAYNPVDWYEWGEEVFAKARAEDKPIFLSVGYSSCHWCHVMAPDAAICPRLPANLRALAAGTLALSSVQFFPQFSHVGRLPLASAARAS